MQDGNSTTVGQVYKEAGNWDKQPSNGATAGFVYVLSNEAMPGLLKIGHTFDDVSARAFALSRATGVPAPFKVEFFCQSTSAAKDERRIHRKLKNHRYHPNREFFSAELNLVQKVVFEVCGSQLFKKRPAPPKKDEFQKTIAELGRAMFRDREKIIIDRIMSNLPSPLLVKNSDQVFLGWKPREKKEKSIMGFVYKLLIPDPNQVCLDEWTRNLIKRFCKDNGCSVVRQGNGYRIRRGHVGITINSQSDFSKPRFEEIVKGIKRENRKIYNEARFSFDQVVS